MVRSQVAWVRGVVIRFFMPVVLLFRPLADPPPYSAWYRQPEGSDQNVNYADFPTHAAV